MAEKSYDAVIVGSCAAGGWAAKKLTRAGLRVAVIEAGRALSPHKDFRDHTLPSQLPLRGKSVAKKTLAAQPVQSTSYAYSEQTSHFFVKDLEHPYTTPA